MIDLATNEHYKNNHISLEAVITGCWSRNNSVEDAMRECIRMGYQVDKEDVEIIYATMDAKLEYFKERL